MRGINLSVRSEVPIYQQLFEQLTSQILRAELKSDFSLPAIRTAAKELRVSIITVKKAWEELERAGLIYTVTGRGCFVSELSKKERQEKREQILKDKMEQDSPFYRNMGVDQEEMIKLVKGCYKNRET